MIEHEPWIGEHYRSGIAGRRIAIMGHSHHRGRDPMDWKRYPDANDNTVRTVERMLSEDPDWQFSFFDRIRKYFDYDGHKTFWPRVLFMNLMPERLDDMYDPGTAEQQARARIRFKRVMRKCKPHTIFVFSKKAW